MIKFFVSVNRVEVYHLKNLLEAAGVHLVIRNEFLHSVAGEIPFTECGVELWVTRPEELALAERVLAAFRAPVSSDVAPWTCEHCGESCEPQFTACWQCGAARIS